MPFPIGHALVGASIFTASQSRASLAKDWKMMLLAASLATLPDLDFIFAVSLRLGDLHRGFTHSLVFALAVGVLPSVLGAAERYRARIGLVLASLSHALLDAVTTNKGIGVELLWPITDHRFRLGPLDYYSFKFDPGGEPWSNLTTHLLNASLLDAIIFGPMLLLVLLMRLRAS